MSDYPLELFDLIEDNYESIGDIRRLVEQTGADWGLVDDGGNKKTALHSALKQVCTDAQVLDRLPKLVQLIQKDGYMTEPTVRVVDDLLVRKVRETTDNRLLSLQLADLDPMVGVLASVYHDVDGVRNLAAAAGLTEQELAQVRWSMPDHRAVCRSLLVVAALAGKASPLLKRIVAENSTTPTITSLQIKWDDHRAEGGRSTTPDRDKLRGDAPAQRSGGDATTFTRPGSGNPTGAKTGRAGASDLARKVQLAEQRSALRALDRLQRLMDEALEAFAHEDARDTPPTVSVDQPPEAFADAVIDLGGEIDNRRLSAETDESELIELLERLISTVLVGVEVAESVEDFATVANLAEEAASAYESVAAVLDDDRGQLLSRVVPFWQMKAAHAGHEHKVREQRQRLDGPTTKTAGVQRALLAGVHNPGVTR